MQRVTRLPATVEKLVYSLEGIIKTNYCNLVLFFTMWIWIRLTITITEQTDEWDEIP